MLKLPENGHQKRATFKPVLQQIRSQQPNLLQDRFDSWVLKLATSLPNFFCRMLQKKLHVLGFRYIGTVRKKNGKNLCSVFGNSKEFFWYLSHHWFPREMTSEKRAQKFHTDDVVESNFPRGTTNQKHYPDLGIDTSSVWNFCTRFSVVILRCHHWFHREMTSEKRAQKFHTDDASLQRSG